MQKTGGGNGTVILKEFLRQGIGQIAQNSYNQPLAYVNKFRLTPPII